MADVSFGLLLPTGCESEFTGCSGQAAWRMLERLAVAGETAGFEYLWVGDHLLGVRPGGNGGGPVLEAWTVLAALASVTRRCRVGVFVSNVSFRARASGADGRDRRRGGR